MYIETRDNISTFKVIRLHNHDAGISALLLYPNSVHRFSPGEAHNKCPLYHYYFS